MGRSSANGESPNMTTATGTHSGASWSGVEPTGKSVAMDGIDHFVVRDGKVVSSFVVFDQTQFARAVGAAGRLRGRQGDEGRLQRPDEAAGAPAPLSPNAPAISS